MPICYHSPLAALLVGLALASLACGGGTLPGPTAPRPTGTTTSVAATPLPTRGPALSRTGPARQSAGGRTKWGVHLLLDDGLQQWPRDVWDEHLAYARRLVGPGGYVVELIRADDLDSEKWQGFLDGAQRHGLNPIIRLATWQDRAAGHWVAPPADPNGNTYHELAARYARFISALRGQGPRYVLVGNEPNRGDEWGGYPDPAAYARYLIDVSSALHATAPGRVLVLNGALDQFAPNTRGQAPGGFRAYDAAGFLDGMQAAEPTVWQAIDLWASHAYPLGPFAAHPAERDFQIDDLGAADLASRTPPWPGLFNRGLNSYRWELYKLRSFGLTRDLEVFITETGWRHRGSQSPSSDAVGATVQDEDAAAFLKLAFDGDPLLDPQEYTWTPWSADRDVAAAIIFALAGDPTRWGHTNLLDVGARGEILGIKPAFRPLFSE
jgi:hypothetical protein